jgi:hypothetical protein
MESGREEGEPNAETAWNELIEGIATGKVSILQTIKHSRATLWAEGDHLGFVNATRALHVMFDDKRIQKRFLDESMAEFEWIAKPKAGYQERQRRDIETKDGFRLFGKLRGVQADAYVDSPRLIPPGNQPNISDTKPSLAASVRHPARSRRSAKGRCPPN